MVLKYTKTVLEFWAGQAEDHMVLYVATSMASVHSLFTINPHITRKFIVQLARSLVHVRESQAKLGILLACKSLLSGLESELLVRFFKVIVAANDRP